MIDYGVKDIRTLEGIEAIRLIPGITPLKCPYCKQSMNLIDGYLTLSHWLCKKCKKEYEFDGKYRAYCRRITCGRTSIGGIKVSFTDSVPALVRNGKLTFINFL